MGTHRFGLGLVGISVNLALSFWRAWRGGHGMHLPCGLCGRGGNDIHLLLKCALGWRQSSDALLEAFDELILLQFTTSPVSPYGPHSSRRTALCGGRGSCFRRFGFNILVSGLVQSRAAKSYCCVPSMRPFSSLAPSSAKNASRSSRASRKACGPW